MFHASNVDLSVGDYLQPSKYNGRLYATNEKWQCLIFGDNANSLRDLGSILGSFKLENGELGLQYMEHFPNIFEEEFKGKSTYVYEVEDVGFVPGGWDVEYYKTTKAKIIKKYKVKDLYTELMKYEKLGKIKLDLYVETKHHIELVINHLMQQITNGYCKIEDVIALAKRHNAKAVEDYFMKLKKLNKTTLDSLPNKPTENLN